MFIRAHPFWYSGKWRYFSQTGDNSCYFPTHSTKLGVIPIEYWLFIVYKKTPEKIVQNDNLSGCPWLEITEKGVCESCAEFRVV